MINSTKPAGEISKGKRKANPGTRSVSTLTPSQLARKRANDREAQRAIRARTKEHIESLEKEIEELRSFQNRDQTIQTLLRRNKALEEELTQIRESMGIHNAGDQYHSVLNSSSPPGPHLLAQSAPQFSMIQNVASYESMSDATDAWPTRIPCSISSASSPPSSAETDDFGNNYIPSGASTVYERPSLSPNTCSPTGSGTSAENVFDDTKSGMYSMIFLFIFNPGLMEWF
ncbi:uncharacterized protein F4812DRAFT_471178 [Daldinia caldariorum]|uniref:uncharacterized protein n=1 Tax=Daldinia caldariorum TaxID=326644 RepID=UPI002008B92A|nr:uncharacterized protein F4812DRAFT_471178 [Daldinia caldariorum]KAI1467798.1 hypothetical protein F4812DRAFT_471178 [Daldinia caldariorum]